MGEISTIPILLLAAGQSRRMRGADKLLEIVDGSPLIERQASAASEATNGMVYVTLPPAPHDRYAAISHLDVTPVPVRDAQHGMSESLKGGLAALPPDTRAVMILLADLPDLTTGDLRRVLDAVDLTSGFVIWRGTAADGTPGHPIVVSSTLFGAINEISGDSGGADVMRTNRHRTSFVALPDQHAVRDLDTPEDWAAWRTSRDA